MKRVTMRILDTIDRINERLGQSASLLTLVMSAVMLFEILSRYSFHRGTNWAAELDGLLVGAFLLLGSGYSLTRRASPKHIKMDLFYERFSPRKKAISLVCGSLLFFIFTGVMLWQGTLLAIISTVQRETSSSSWAPPLYPTKWILTVGVFFFILQGIAQFISNLFVAITGKGALHE